MKELLNCCNKAGIERLLLDLFTDSIKINHRIESFRRESMTKKRILTVDDEENILDLIRYNLSREGFDVLSATSGEEALRLARVEQPDLIILDLMLPGVPGMEVAKRLKHDAETEKIPIVMLTAKSGEADVVTGLEIGADDYITKPFSPKVLVARVRTVLRRQEATDYSKDAVIKTSSLVVDPGRHEVRLKGENVELTLTEFRLLHLLAGRPGWVFTRNQIVDAVRGTDYAVTDRSVDVHIAGLRKKLGSEGNLIETVRGIGYRFRSDTS
jgi:two-component system phosphate regulon response regulator PhoB